jgi:hypothetical protein
MKGIGRRGFLGAIGAGLAALKAVVPAKRVEVAEALLKDPREYAPIPVAARVQEFNIVMRGPQNIGSPAEDGNFPNFSPPKTLTYPAFYNPTNRTVSVYYEGRSFGLAPGEAKAVVGWEAVRVSPPDLGQRVR